jgi:hypothetical protein
MLRGKQTVCVLHHVINKDVYLEDFQHTIVDLTLTGRTITKLLEASGRDSDAIDEKISQIQSLVSNESPKPLEAGLGMLTATNELRLQLLARATALGALDRKGISAALVQIDIQKDPAPPVAAVAPAKKAGKGKGKAPLPETAVQHAVELPVALLNQVDTQLTTVAQSLRSLATNYCNKRDPSRAVTREAVGKSPSICRHSRLTCQH